MKNAWSVEVWYKPEVTDPVEDSVMKGVADLDVQGLKSVRTGQKFLLQGSLARDQVERICKELLANPVMQEYRIQSVKGLLPVGAADVAPASGRKGAAAVKTKGKKLGRPPKAKKGRPRK